MKMKQISVVACGLALVASSIGARAEGDKAKIAERLNEASAVIRQIMDTPDKSIPSSNRQVIHAMRVRLSRTATLLMAAAGHHRRLSSL